MDMQGQRVLHVTQAQAWDALNDPEILKSCIPGCDKFSFRCLINLLWSSNLFYSPLIKDSNSIDPLGQYQLE